MVASTVASEASPSAFRKALDFYWGNYLPLMMIFVVFFGYFVPAPGKAMDKPKIDLCGEGEPDCDMGSLKVVSSICIICIFILSGLGLKTDDVKKAVVQGKAIGYAFISINFMTGCVALIMMQLPFVPQELSIGLSVFCAMPTTLSSGAVLVGQAGGNVTLALLLTAGTNILAIFTIPFLLKLYLSTESDIKINPVPMLVKLLATILVPLVIGKLLRQIKPLADFRLANKKWFTIASSTFLIVVPMMKVSTASDSISEMAIGNLLLTILSAILLHLFYLAFNTMMTIPLNLDVAERKAVIILTSQKTLPVAVTVISFLDGESLGDRVLDVGIVVIPCILCHLCQLLIDGVFVSKWATMTEAGGPFGLGLAPPSDDDEAHRVQKGP